MWAVALLGMAAGIPPIALVSDVGASVRVSDEPDPSIVAGSLPEPETIGAPVSVPPGRSPSVADLSDTPTSAPEETPKVVRTIIAEDLTDSSRGAWGNPIYPDELPSWSAFAKAVGSLSRECDPRAPELACGSELVCRKGLCAACMHDSECMDKHQCRREVDGRANVCVQRDLLASFSTSEFWLSFWVFVCTVLSAASGVGGGGMFVPLFLIFLEMKPTDAVPLSQSLILVSSAVNLAFFIFQRNPMCRTRPKIDYELVMLLEPGLAAGVIVGVQLNQVSPRWLITALLVGTLGLSFARTSQKAVSLWIKESQEQPIVNVAAVESGKKDEEESTFDFDALALLHNYRVQIGTTVVVWLCTFLSNFHNVKTCSWQFAFYLCAFFLAMVAITYGSAQYLRGTAQQGRSEEELAAGIQWTGYTTTVYPCVSFTAGLLGGMLGLGGGMVMAPFLVELGLHPEVIQASTALFVFISSTLATLQFATKDQVLPEYMMVYGAVAFCATLLGQTVVLTAIRRSGRGSIIVMCIAAVLIVSLVMLTWLGIVGTLADLESGAYMGLDFYKLCIQ